jgi:predicted Fe-Mo cluster-binding NifX family protein
MKIAITTTGTTLTDAVDPRFGRCANFIFVDTDLVGLDSDTAETQPNTAVSSGHGAGVQAAQFVVERGAEAIIAGRFGPNAAQVFQTANVKTYIAQEMTVQQAIDAFRAGTLSAAA